jgi:hypothetical protein
MGFCTVVFQGIQNSGDFVQFEFGGISSGIRKKDAEFPKAGNSALAVALLRLDNEYVGPAEPVT